MIHTSEKEPSNDKPELEALEPILSYEEQLEEQLESTVRTIYFYE